MLIASPPPSGSGAVDAARAFLAASVAAGLRHLVLAPGSRSAPLVYAAHALVESGEPLRLHVRHDERAAAFTALGLSRAGELAAVGTTSGTATAHLLAAVMEAHHSAVPLLVLTADRPAELRGTGANQTTRQVGLYGDFPVFAADLPAPTADRATETQARLAADTAARAVAAAQGLASGQAGPAHVNLGFRDPLTPSHGGGPGHPGPSDHTAPAQLRVATREHARITGEPLELDPRTVIVAGDGPLPTGSPHPAAALAEQLHLPLLAEPSSNARVPGAPLVPAYPRAISAIMGEPQSELRPREILVVGHPTLTRPVMRELLGARDARITVVSPRTDWPDAPRSADRIVSALDASVSTLAGEADPEFTAGWIEAGQRHAGEARALATPQARAALAVWEACADGEHPLVLGASALIRDLDLLAGPSAAPVVSNRGLAGIDGTISTAAGVGLVLSQGRTPGNPGPARTRVLLGDVTAIHDLTGLVIGPAEAQPNLDIVVVDDNGGRIFGGLEHAGAPGDVLERFFTTPHGVDLAGAIEALGVPVARVSPDGLGEALAAGTEATGRRAFLVRL